MDVRCKYCHVEYEVDDARLSDGATMIPCVNCGLPFKVEAPDAPAAEQAAPVAEEAAPAAEEAAPIAEDAAPEATESPGSGPVDAPGKRKFRRARTSSLGSGPTPERRWLVRSPDGELREVPELTMLQKWIFTGLVTRDWDITLDADTWKPLGNIQELQPFFGFAEEAYQAWTTSAGDLIEKLTAEKEAGSESDAGPRRKKEDSAVELDISQLEEIADDEPATRAKPMGARLAPPRAPPARPRTEQGMPPPIPPHADDGEWLLVDDESVFEVLHPEFVSTPVTAAEPGEEVVLLDKPRAATPPPVSAADLASAAPVELPAPAAPAPTEVPLPSAEARLPQKPPGATKKATTPPARTRVRESSNPIPLADLDSPPPPRRHPDSPSPVAGAVASTSKAVEADDDWHVGPRPKPLAKPAPPQSSGGRAVLGLALAAAALFAVYWFAIRDRPNDTVAAGLDDLGDAGPVAMYTPADAAAPVLPPDAAEMANAGPPDAAPVAVVEPKPDKPPDKPDKPPERKESFTDLVKKAEAAVDAEDCKSAIGYYEKAIKLNARSTTALSGLGFCYLDGGKYSSAHDAFTRALRITPGHVESLIGVADTYAQQGNKAKAIEAYRKVLAVRPDGYHAKIARRQITRLGGDPDAGDKPAPTPAPAPAPDPAPDTTP